MKPYDSPVSSLLASRKALTKNSAQKSIRKAEGEGGCGVIGLACTEKLPGRHLLVPLGQMRNRGNGKGGGIAAVGLSANALGITQEILETDYLLAVAYLDKKHQSRIERDFIEPIFAIDHACPMESLKDYTRIQGLDVCPPYVYLYFVRVKKEISHAFQEKHRLEQLSLRDIEDEIVYQNSYRLNQINYAEASEKQAFVLSHGKNLLVLKMVGYGDDVIRYYQLENFAANVWIGHHRYPTKGQVWHPGGAHPFIGVNEALVHNGDFANYFSICEFLAQRNIHPLFLTDTEVSVLIFDLLHRVYKYPLEYIVESLAPTTERDFALLANEKKTLYKQLQISHIHGSPDGPWFFLIAQSLQQQNDPVYRLIGITDTSMLRPQVFAMQKGAVSIGLAASEKQAIDAALSSLSKEDGRFWPCADSYWNARGGSYTDGGAFIFNIRPKPDGKASFECTDKFGKVIRETSVKPSYENIGFPLPSPKSNPQGNFPDQPAQELLIWAKNHFFNSTYAAIESFFEALALNALQPQDQHRAIQVFTNLLDQRHSFNLRSSCIHALLNKYLSLIFRSIQNHSTLSYAYSGFNTVRPHPSSKLQTLVLNAKGFPPEGEASLAREIVTMYSKGFKKIIVFDCEGQRFIGNGLGAHSNEIRIDVYGSSGDYIGSGIDGAEIHVHGSCQDQAAQIMNNGRLVVHGDVGQTFMYGSKGGKAFVRGNTAGRALINVVGNPRVIVNGTSLDYLAESCMAGNPLQEGGFILVNGIEFSEEGQILDLDVPYSGGNLFSLASGGAIYIRDPKGKLSKEQLNGGEFTEVAVKDWELILPYLEENAEIFDIPVKRLLECDGHPLEFYEAYRKIIPVHSHILQEEEAWVKGFQV
jgi:glutamate synthase domain-containing protein 1/glutamate synthase domain-containing protein 3